MKKLYLLAFFAIFVACTTDSDGGEFNASEDCPVSARGTFVDERDGQIYKYTTIGGQVWMAENLNYEIPGVTRDMYGTSCTAVNDNCDGRGLLYNYSSADTACPKGWHLPSQDEWNALYGTMGGIEIAGERLKATEGWARGNRDDPPGGTDDCGFALLPALATNTTHEGYASRLWSLSKKNNGRFFIEYFHSNQNDAVVGSSQLTSDAYSVRCLKN